MGYAEDAMNELHGTDVFTEERRLSGVAPDLLAEMEAELPERAGAVVRGSRWLPPIYAEVFEELKKARATHAPMNGHHEGYAVILEELDELWTECKSNTHAKSTPESERPALREAKRQRLRKEALQVAAMAVRFIEDVCDKHAT